MAETALPFEVPPSAAGPRPDTFERMDKNKLGVLVFISSEVVFFVTLILTYIAYRYSSTAGPGPGVLNVLLTGIFSVFLFSSSFTMHKVTERAAEHDAAGTRRWLVITLSLGLIFLVGQAYEYIHLYLDNITIARNLWSSTFFTLTGFHGFHVFVGVLSMAILASLIQPRGDGMRGAEAVEAFSYYWHFVDAVWVVIFPVVYLWPLLS
jgi:heme/copper-type cytochrome/quinol oxidase subunit 3